MPEIEKPPDPPGGPPGGQLGGAATGSGDGGGDVTTESLGVPATPGHGGGDGGGCEVLRGHQGSQAVSLLDRRTGEIGFQDTGV